MDSYLTYEEKPVKILEFASRVTRSKVIKFCKVQWSHHTEDEVTWEQEEDLLKGHDSSDEEIVGIMKNLVFNICNIPNFQFGMLYIRSSMHIIFYFCILVDPRKFYATQGPMERVGDFVIFIFEFSQILRIGSFDFIYFIINYFYYKNMREGIK